MEKSWTDHEIKWMFDTTCSIAFKFREFDCYERQDFVQSAMIKAIQKRDGRLPTASWLYLTTRSVVLDLARRVERRCKASSLQFEDLTCQKSAFTAAKDTASSVLDAQIDQVFDGLSKVHRDVLALRGEGCSYEEIARKTGMAIGTVRSRIHYARKRARKLTLQKT